MRSFDLMKPGGNVRVKSFSICILVSRSSSPPYVVWRGEGVCPESERVATKCITHVFVRNFLESRKSCAGEQIRATARGSTTTKRQCSVSRTVLIVTTVILGNTGIDNQHCSPEKQWLLRAYEVEHMGFMLTKVGSFSAKYNCNIHMH